jgi:hypothetical protein
MFICSRPSEIVWVTKYSTHVLHLDTDLWINWILRELKAGDKALGDGTTIIFHAPEGAQSLYHFWISIYPHLNWIRVPSQSAAQNI